MQDSTPKQVALLVAACAAALASGMLFLSHILSPVYLSALVILNFIVVFIVVYVLTFNWLFTFFFDKINPIYRIIEKNPHNELALKKKLKKRSSVKEVGRDVLGWAQTRTEELDQLKKLEKYRREFLGNVSHELKTPIFSIQGYILTLLDGGIDDPDINRKYLEKTEKSINRMISIIEDLESISRLESGELIINYEVFSMVSLVKEVFEMQEDMAQKMNIKLRLAQNFDKPVKVRADRKRITDVMNNLILNGIKYGKPNSSVEVGFFDLGKMVLIEVTDDGIGIPTRDQARVFERFYRVDKSRSRDAGGTGLGLAIVKHIIEAHGQTINLQSKEGKGSTFSFTLEKG